MENGRIMPLAYDSRSYENLPSPVFAKPVEIGYFSILEDDTSAFDRSQLKALCLPPDVPRKSITFTARSPQWDLLRLNQGWASSINLADGFTFNPSLREHDEVKVYINPLLRWILHNRQQIIASPRLVQTPPTLFQCCFNAEFVCMRSVLKEIARTLYRPKDAWTLNVLRWQNVYFLVKIERNEDPPSIPVSEEYIARCEFCGPRFEQLSTRTRDHTGARRSSSCAQFCSVVQAQLKSTVNNKAPHHLLCAGEIDCEDSCGVYTELKLRPSVHNEEDLPKFAAKVVDVWLQCLFIGVPKVVIGFRDNSFYLQSIAEMRTEDIPSLAEAIPSRSRWKPSTGLNFLERFLAQLKAEITADDLNTVYEIKYIPRRSTTGMNSGFQSGVQIRRLNEAEFAKDESFKFFRESFAQHFTAGRYYSDKPKTPS